MTELDHLPQPVVELAERLDAAIRDVARTELERALLVPALATCVARHVAYEAGDAARIPRGLQIAWSLMRLAAISEAAKLYGPEACDKP
jgi:hypothetical protein